MRREHRLLLTVWIAALLAALLLAPGCTLGTVRTMSGGADVASSTDLLVPCGRCAACQARAEGDATAACTNPWHFHHQTTFAAEPQVEASQEGGLGRYWLILFGGGSLAGIGIAALLLWLQQRGRKPASRQTTAPPSLLSRSGRP